MTLKALGLHAALPPQASSQERRLPPTQDDQPDGAPVVLCSGLDFAAVFSRVCQRQVADHQGGVAF